MLIECSLQLYRGFSDDTVSVVVDIYGNLSDPVLWKAHDHGKPAVPEVVTTVVLKHLEPLVERVQHLFNYYKVWHDTKLLAQDKQNFDDILDQYAKHKISQIKEMAAFAFRYYSRSFVPDLHQFRAKNDLLNIKMPATFHTRDKYADNSKRPSGIQQKMLRLPMIMHPLVPCVDELFKYFSRTIKQIDDDVNRFYRNPHMTLASIPVNFDLQVVPCVNDSHELNVQKELTVIRDFSVKQIQATAAVMRTFIQTRPSADRPSLTGIVDGIKTESVRTLSRFGRAGAQGLLRSPSLQQIIKDFIDEINELGVFDIQEMTTLFDKEQHVEE